VHDFKVLYCISGSKGARSRRPCPWCGIPMQLLDKSNNEILDMTVAIPKRKDILNLTNGTDTVFQKGGTHNLFGLHQPGDSVSFFNFLPPFLHIQIGIINKILDVMDLIVLEWQEVRKYPSDVKNSPVKIHLSENLSKLGVIRENYYSGAIAGPSCLSLMKHLRKFCTSFFSTRFLDCPKLIDEIPSVQKMMDGLLEIADLWNGQGENIGMCHLLNFQGKWPPYYHATWKTLSRKFVEKLTETIGRPPKSSPGYNDNAENIRIRTPLRLPKLHALAVHGGEVAEQWGGIGYLMEQSLEHFHKYSNKIRATFSANQCQGQQIIENMRQTWVKSSSELMRTQKEAEDIRISQGVTIKKRRFNSIED